MILNRITSSRPTRSLSGLLVLFMMLASQLSVAGVWGDKWGAMKWGAEVGATAATASELQVTEAYIGLLGRAPDPAGLAYWVSQLNRAVAAGQNATFALKKLTNDIALSPEWTNGLGANDATTQAGADAVVQGMYQNLFERAATQADLDWWTPQLTGGSTTASEMALNLITAAKSNTAKPTDGNVMGYKREAATYYVQNVAQNTFTVTSAINAVKDVSDPASLAASKAVTDSLKRGVANASNIASQPTAAAERSVEGSSTQGAPTEDPSQPAAAADGSKEGSSIKAAPTAIPSLPLYGLLVLCGLLTVTGLRQLRR